MGEGIEGGFPSISTLTRVSHAAKSEGGNRAVKVGIVDGGTT